MLSQKAFLSPRDKKGQGVGLVLSGSRMPSKLHWVPLPISVGVGLSKSQEVTELSRVTTTQPTIPSLCQDDIGVVAQGLHFPAHLGGVGGLANDLGIGETVSQVVYLGSVAALGFGVSHSPQGRRREGGG